MDVEGWEDGGGGKRLLRVDRAPAMTHARTRATRLRLETPAQEAWRLTQWVPFFYRFQVLSHAFGQMDSPMAFKPAYSPPAVRVGEKTVPVQHGQDRANSLNAQGVFSDSA